MESVRISAVTTFFLISTLVKCCRELVRVRQAGAFLSRTEPRPSWAGGRPVSPAGRSPLCGEGMAQEPFLMSPRLNHGAQMSESPRMNAAFHVGVSRDANNSGFISAANTHYGAH